MFDLEHYNYIKTIFRNIKGLRIPFVFTKFENLVNDILSNLETEGISLDDFSSEQIMELVRSKAQIVLNKLKEEIDGIFPEVAVYFIYDPITEGWHCDSNLKLFIPGEEPQTDIANFYAINEAYYEIRNDLNYKFLDIVKEF